MVMSMLAAGEFAALGCWQSEDESLNAAMLKDKMTPGSVIPGVQLQPIAFPGRQVVAVVGDGGISMSLAELATVYENWDGTGLPSGMTVNVSRIPSSSSTMRTVLGLWLMALAPGEIADIVSGG